MIEKLMTDRVTELLAYRRWYRNLASTRRPHWRRLEYEHRVELRALVRLLRAARQAAEATAAADSVWRVEPTAAARFLFDRPVAPETELEKAGAWGR